MVRKTAEKTVTTLCEGLEWRIRIMRAQRPGLFPLASGRIPFDLRLNEDGRWKEEGGKACAQ